MFSLDKMSFLFCFVLFCFVVVFVFVLFCFLFLFCFVLFCFVLFFAINCIFQEKNSVFSIWQARCVLNRKTLFISANYVFQKLCFSLDKMSFFCFVVVFVFVLFCFLFCFVLFCFVLFCLFAIICVFQEKNSVFRFGKPDVY